MPSRAAETADLTTGFFRELQERGYEPSLAKVSGTLRFDIANGSSALSHWLVNVEKGNIEVSRRKVRADCVIAADRALFEKVVSGRLNAFAAVLREAMSIQGKIGLLVFFQRLFPAPPRNER